MRATTGNREGNKRANLALFISLCALVLSFATLYQNYYHPPEISCVEGAAVLLGVSEDPPQMGLLLSSVFVNRGAQAGIVEDLFARLTFVDPQTYNPIDSVDMKPRWIVNPAKMSLSFSEGAAGRLSSEKLEAGIDRPFSPIEVLGRSSQSVSVLFKLVPPKSARASGDSSFTSGPGLYRLEIYFRESDGDWKQRQVRWTAITPEEFESLRHSGLKYMPTQAQVDRRYNSPPEVVPPSLDR